MTSNSKNRKRFTRSSRNVIQPIKFDETITNKYALEPTEPSQTTSTKRTIVRANTVVGPHSIDAAPTKNKSHGESVKQELTQHSNSIRSKDESGNLFPFYTTQHSVPSQK